MEMRRKPKNIITTIIICAFFALGLVFAWKFIAQASKLLILAGIIAALLSPLCRLYEKRMPSGIAAALSLATAMIFVLLALAAIMVPLVNSLISMYKSLPEISSAVQNTVSPILSETGAAKLLPSDIPDSVSSSVFTAINHFITGAVGFIGSAADIILAAVVAWYLLTDRERILLRVELIIPAKHRHAIIEKATDARTEIIMYLRGQSIIAVCVGLLSAAGLFVIGLENAIPLGVTAGILNMIPYLGPVIACIPVGAIALTQGFVPFLLSICVLIAVQQIDGLILSPKIVGSSTGFAPAVIMIAIFAAGAVWSIAGMLAVLPVMILIRTGVRVFVELRQNY